MFFYLVASEIKYFVVKICVINLEILSSQVLCTQI